MQINRVAVVGAGTMGSSIAVALSAGGFPVMLKDVDQAAVQAGLARVERLIEGRVRKGLSRQDADRQLALIEPVVDYSSFADVDLVVEAVAENVDVKRAVFRDLDDCCNVNAILASNTSSLSITQLGAFTRRPDKVVGMHFFNPAHLMKLVEVIPGLDTSTDTVKTALELGSALGKLSVRVEECASFLVNRLLGRYMNEALWCLQEGAASVEEIDAAAVDYVMPVGPLALRDMNGADIGLAVARFNYQEYGERFRPAPVLEEMVARNLLGQKTGAGFYTYDPETRRRSGANPQLAEILVDLKSKRRVADAGRTDTTDPLAQVLSADYSQPPGERKGGFSVERLFLPMVNEAFLALQEKVCSVEDLDPALIAGLGMRRGPLALAAEIGLSDCLKLLEGLFEQHGARFRPAPLLKRYVWAGRTTVV